MRIRGAEHLSVEQLEVELALGGRLVFYEYCLSVLIATARRPSEVYFLPAGDLGVVRGLPFVILSLLFGWWGIPFGLLYTPLTIFTNLCGGRDLSPQATAEVLGLLRGLADAGGPGEES